jgi:hypothetical protein
MRFFMRMGDLNRGKGDRDRIKRDFGVKTIEYNDRRLAK